MAQKTFVLTSGYFNPLHPGHIDCLKLCKELGDELRVIVNNDVQVRLKTQQDEVFQNEQFRMQVVGALKGVDEVVLSVDEDGSVVKSIVSIVERIKQEYGEDVKIVFGKGGDRFSGNIPEVQVCRELGIEIRDGLGEKTHNSSEYRAKAK